MLSFWEMDCLVRQHQEEKKKFQEALNIDPARKAELARRAAMIKANPVQGATAPAPVPEPTKIEPPQPDINPTDISPETGGDLDPATIEKIKSAAQRVMGQPSDEEDGGPVRLNRKGQRGYDLNDPLNKGYTVRGGKSVSGDTTSKQMGTVSTSKNGAIFRANLIQKMSDTNKIMKNWKTLAFIARCVAGDFGYGPLRKLKTETPETQEGGEDNVNTFSGVLTNYLNSKFRTPEQDAKLIEPFAFVLKKGGDVKKDNKFGDLNSYEMKQVPEIVVPDEKVMAKILMKIKEFSVGKGAQKADSQNPTDIVNAAAGNQATEENPEDKVKQILQQKAAQEAPPQVGGQPPKTEATEWMQTFELMEHWGF